MKTFKYQNKKSKNYFEGWYLRFTDQESSQNYAVIFAITKNVVDPHCFIQVFTQYDKECLYVRYPNSAFSFDDISNTISIMDNKMSISKLTVNEHNISIDLTLSDHSFLTKNDKPVSAMSFLQHFPLECFQEVLYFDANFKGTVSGKEVNGIAYSEKTFGISFPKKWVWLQSSYGQNSSFSFSVGKVPFKFLIINGFFLLIKTKDKLYRFSTTNMSKISVDSTDSSVSIKIKKGKYLINLYADVKDTTKLVGPTNNGLMNLDVFEGLSSTASIKIYKNNKVIFEDQYKNVGAENMYSQDNPK